MPDAVTDTHALIWYLEDDPRLGPDAGLLFDACDRGQITIYVPTMCLVEIVFLQEKGRIAGDLKTKLNAELGSGATGLRLADLTESVVEAMALIPTRYDGSHLNSSGEVQLARKTEWLELRPEVWVGQGQRVFTSESGDHALMDVREITFQATAA